MSRVTRSCACTGLCAPHRAKSRRNIWRDLRADLALMTETSPETGTSQERLERERERERDGSRGGNEPRAVSRYAIVSSDDRRDDRREALAIRWMNFSVARGLLYRQRGGMIGSVRDPGIIGKRVGRETSLRRASISSLSLSRSVPPRPLPLRLAPLARRGKLICRKPVEHVE